MDTTNVVDEVEVWKPVVGYEGLYEISNFGRVKSLPRFHRVFEKILKESVGKRTGYATVELCKAGVKNKRCTIHRLCAIAFLDNPENKPSINHKDGNKSNNRLDNLEWCTHSENQKHACIIGLRSAKGVKNSQVKLTEEKVIAIRNLLRLGTLKQKEIAATFDVTHITISDIKRGRSWTHLK